MKTGKEGRQRPEQLSLFPEFDLEIAAQYQSDIYCLIREIGEVKREASRKTCTLQRRIMNIVANIYALALSNWQLFFAGKKRSKALGNEVGWSSPRPRVILSGNATEVVEYLKWYGYVWLIKEVPDLGALGHDIEIARAVPGLEVVTDEKHFWVKSASKKFRISLSDGKRLTLRKGKRVG